MFFQVAAVYRFVSISILYAFLLHVLPIVRLHYATLIVIRVKPMKDPRNFFPLFR